MKKRKNISIFPLLIMGVFILFASSCEKDDDNEPSSKDTMTDQDGNVYKTVIIGGQTWMAENLRTTKYNDGTAIPNVFEDDQWNSLTTGAYCNYDNAAGTVNIATYGLLYNWHAVNTGKLAPKGWHVPTDAEWTELTEYLGGESVAGGKLKETGTTHWNPTNIGATNETGFTALPGGYRWPTFFDIGSRGLWWSATYEGGGDAWYREIYGEGPGPYSPMWRGDLDVQSGLSVRCVRY